MFLRNSTKVIHVGNVKIGGGNPIIVQSMTNTKTMDVPATVAQIKQLEAAGCELVRVAVPNLTTANVLPDIKKQINIPLVADIHFDYKIAIESIKNGADAIRINPGNIGGYNCVKAVAEVAKQYQVPIRVGVNAGSLDAKILEKHGGVNAEALAESAVVNVRMLEDCDFDNIVVSVKASNINLMTDASQLLAQHLYYPQHIGLTEAGTPYKGAIRSSVALGILLKQGLGDTIRVSISGDPVEEIKVAKEILQSLGLRKFGITIIACPTCGRTDINVIELADRLEMFLENNPKPLTIAVMGCSVNGPGEAREADLGIAGGKGNAVLFRKGKIIRKVNEDDLFHTLLEEIDRYEIQ